MARAFRWLLLLSVGATPALAQDGVGLRPASFGEIAPYAAAAEHATNVYAPDGTGPRLGLTRPDVAWVDYGMAPGGFGQDTLAPWRPDEKRFGMALAEIGIALAIPYVVNRYIIGEEWALVGPDTWWENLTNPWVWDDDMFITNQFAHPYHGNMYFNAGRSNGYDFWASSAFTVFGSWTWEVFGETNAPAINDMISTTMGGMAFGEVTHRLANMLRDNTKRGSGRTWREIGGFFIDPMGSFSRMTRGELGMVRGNDPDRLPSRFAITVSGGGQMVANKIPGEETEETGQFVASAEMVYGNPFVDTLAKPFSTFRAIIDIATNNDFAIQRLNYEGALLGQTKHGDAEQGSHFLMLTQRYLYFKNPALEFGGVALNGKYGKLWVHSDNWATLVEAGGGWVVLGAMPSDILLPEGRDYDFTTGGTVMLEGSMLHRGRPFLRVSGQSAYLDVVNGSARNHLINAGSAALYAPIKGRMSAGLLWLGFWRDSRYADRVDKGQANQVRLFGSWSFGYSRNPMRAVGGD